MIRKFFIAFIFLASTSIFAMQTIPWDIASPTATWFIPNPTGHVNVSFTVFNGMPGKPGTPDPITLMCSNGVFKVTAGHTINCTLTNFVQGQFHIETYKNGSEGTYTTS